MNNLFRIKFSVYPIIYNIFLITNQISPVKSAAKSQGLQIIYGTFQRDNFSPKRENGSKNRGKHRREGGEEIRAVFP